MAATVPLDYHAPTPSRGGTVARAKRTERADARRRHRADVAAAQAAADEAAAAAAAGDPSGEAVPATGYGRKSRPDGAANQKPPTPQRLGFVAAMRSSYQVADVRGDLRSLPMLLRSRSFLIPAGLSLVSFVVALVTVNTPNTVTVLLVTLFLGPLPIGSIYAAGALAPKASWLMGGIASLIGTIGLVSYALIGTSVISGSASPQLTDVLYALSFYTVFGAVIGAGLGFYRRLLRAMNPTPERSGAKSKPKPGTKAGARAH
jgi:hypothetical protein